MSNKKLRETNIIDKYSDQYIMIMSSMKRYNNRIRIKDESLAEHSFYVAYNVLKLGYDLNIDEKIINRAVSLAIVHDIPESYTSDLPHDCKTAYPELRTILREIEDTFMEEEMPELLSYFKEYQDKERTICVKLVDLADAISVLQYCTREIQLGNKTDDFKVIMNEIHLRISHLYDDLLNTLKTLKQFKLNKQGENNAK